MQERVSPRDLDIDDLWPERFAAEGLDRLEEYLRRVALLDRYAIPDEPSS